MNTRENQRHKLGGRNVQYILFLNANGKMRDGK